MRAVMLRRQRVMLICLGFLMVLVLAGHPHILTPDGDGYLCVRECSADYHRCYSGCDIFNDYCWDQCLTEFIFCLGGCPELKQRYY